MSTKKNLFNEEYTKNVIKQALDHKKFVMGFIAQEKLTDDKDLVTLIPGISITQNADRYGQNYNSPKIAITKNMADVIIVGRGIYTAKNPAVAARKYKQKAWQYLLSMEHHQ